MLVIIHIIKLLLGTGGLICGFMQFEIKKSQEEK
jgi:hypothetical protein